MVSTFWESIAAPLLQPGPADSSYLAWLDRLVSSGLLRPLLAALAASGEASELQYLLHADADAAVSLLLSLSVATAEPLGMQLLDSAGFGCCSVLCANISTVCNPSCRGKPSCRTAAAHAPDGKPCKRGDAQEHAEHALCDVCSLSAGRAA